LWGGSPANALAAVAELFDAHNSSWPAAAKKNYHVPGFTVVAFNRSDALTAAAVVQRVRGQPAFTIRLAHTQVDHQRRGFMKIVVAAIHRASHTRGGQTLFVEVSRVGDKGTIFRWEDAFGFDKPSRLQACQQDRFHWGKVVNGNSTTTKFLARDVIPDGDGSLLKATFDSVQKSVCREATVRSPSGNNQRALRLIVAQVAVAAASGVSRKRRRTLQPSTIASPPAPSPDSDGDDNTTFAHQDRAVCPDCGQWNECYAPGSDDNTGMKCTACQAIILADPNARGNSGDVRAADSSSAVVQQSPMIAVFSKRAVTRTPEEALIVPPLCYVMMSTVDCLRCACVLRCQY
jgi:hypothetical protein